MNTESRIEKLEKELEVDLEAPLTAVIFPGGEVLYSNGQAGQAKNIVRIEGISYDDI